MVGRSGSGAQASWQQVGRIDVLPVDRHLEVQMATGRVARAAHEGDDIAGFDLVTRLSQDHRVVTVRRGHTTGVLDVHTEPGGALPACPSHCSRGGGADRGSAHNSEILADVELDRVSEAGGVDTPAVDRGDAGGRSEWVCQGGGGSGHKTGLVHSGGSCLVHDGCTGQAPGGDRGPWPGGAGLRRIDLRSDHGPALGNLSQLLPSGLWPEGARRGQCHSGCRHGCGQVVEHVSDPPGLGG